MKFLAALILICFISSETEAQEVQDTFSWHSKKNNSSAFIETIRIADKNRKSKSTLYYITSDDNANNENINSRFKAFSEGHSKTNIVKITFYHKEDSLSVFTPAGFAKEVVQEILPEIRKKYTGLSAENFILAGVNEGASVALFAGVLFPDKINKTGIFIDDYVPFNLLKKEMISLSAQPRGKLFIYVRQKKQNDITADDLADTIAVKSSSVLIYKIDAINEKVDENLFNEFYNWISTEGSNYIIKTE